jgi:tetratricopeptide (TPR) repeat protein
MPRWLSEGISVHEESQADPSWGMHLTPRYREMILDGKMTPVANLSAAFLVPGSAEHLQFAYFESSLVVEYIIGHYGLEQLKGILRDLGAGEEINRAIAAHTEPLPKLEKDFAGYARGKAEQLGPKLEWDRPDPALLAPGEETKLADWTRRHPENYWALQMRSRELVEAKQWSEAKRVLSHFIERDPAQIGADSAYERLAAVHRALGETEEERATLTKLAELDDNATEACLRLMELAREARDWPAEEHFAERFLEVNPLVVPPYRYLAEAAEESGEVTKAIATDRTLLLLGPSDPAEVHFQLARLLWRASDPGARREVLRALEDAPRYREALALLLEINHLPATASIPNP